MISDYYVYMLLDVDEETPFYIGKGRRFRIGQHKTEALRGERGAKNDRIRQIVALLGYLPTQKLRENLTEQEAFACESEMIVFFGRADLGEGPLLNTTDGGEGASGHRQSAEHRAKNSAAHSTPEMRERKRAEMKYRIEHTDWLQKMSAASRRVREDPNAAAKLEAIRIEAFARPGVQERRLRSVRLALCRPEVRRRLSEAIKAASSRPEVRAMKSVAAHTRWQRQRARELLFSIALLHP